MTQHNTLNVKFSNSQLNKLKSGAKSGTEVTLSLSSNLTGNCNDETNFPHKLLLTDTQVSMICKVFANGSSPYIKFSKTQLSKMIQSGKFIYPECYNKFPPFKTINSVGNSFEKELKNAGSKGLNNDLIVDAGLNIISKKIKKGISSITGSGITLANNEMK